MEERRYQYYQLEVPIYVTMRAELIKGLSIKDFWKSILCSVVVLLLLLILRPFLGLSAFAVIVVLAVVFMAVSTYYTRMGESHYSIRDYFVIWLKYKREQKHYPYVYSRKGGKS